MENDFTSLPSQNPSSINTTKYSKYMSTNEANEDNETVTGDLSAVDWGYFFRYGHSWRCVPIYYESKGQNHWTEQCQNP